MKKIRSVKFAVAAIIAAIAVAILCAVLLINAPYSDEQNGFSDPSGGITSGPLAVGKTDAQWAAEGYTALTQELIESGYGNGEGNAAGAIRTAVIYDEATGKYNGEHKFYLKSDISSTYTVVFYNSLYADYTGNTAVRDEIKAGSTVVLDLNGHVLRHTGAYGAAIAVSGNVSLTIKDSAPAVRHRYGVAPQSYTSSSAAETSELIGYKYSVADGESDEDVYFLAGGVITGGKRPSKHVSGITDPEPSPNFTKINTDVETIKKCSHGGVYITYGARVVLESGNISGNYTEDYGGGGVAVFGSVDYFTLNELEKQMASEFTMTGGSICGNLALGANGGGIYADKGGEVTFKGGNIRSNSATNGGGVYINRNGEFVLDGGEISANVAANGNGGGVYVRQDGRFTLLSGKITGNSATGEASSNSGNGGGVYSASSLGGRADEIAADDGYVKIAGGEIKNNSARQGGGVYISSMINGDTAGYAYAGGGAVFSGGNVSGNSASEKGGGVYVDGFMGVKGGAVITGNTVSETPNNVQLGARGASADAHDDVADITKLIYIVGALDPSAKIGIYNTNRPNAGASSSCPANRFARDSGVHTVSDFTLYFNSDTEAYQVLSDGIYGVMGIVAVSLTVDGKTTGYTDFADAAAAVGGKAAALKLLSDVTLDETYSVAAGKTVTLDLNGKILSLKAGLNMPVIEVKGDLTVADGSPNAEHKYEIVQDESHSIYAKSVYVFGEGDYTMLGGIITSGGRDLSQTADGSGVLVSGGTFNLTAGNISGNGLHNNSGGGVSVTSGAFNMTGGNIEGNHADVGGGVDVTGGTFAMSGGSVKKNDAVYRGGGVQVYGGTFIMTGGEVSYNHITCYTDFYSKAMGGGVCVYTGAAYLRGGKINDNSITAVDGVSAYGGGVYYSKSHSGDTSLTLGGSIRIDDRYDVYDIKQNVLYLAESSLTVNTEAFTAGARVVVYADGSRAVTSGFGDSNGADMVSVFVPHDSSYTAVLSGGEVSFKTANDKFIVTSNLGVTYYSDLPAALTYIKGMSGVTSATLSVGESYSERIDDSQYALATFTNKTVVIELNGYDILCGGSMTNLSSPYVFRVGTNGSLTIKGSGRIGYGGIRAMNGGKLIIENVTIEGRMDGSDACNANALIEADGAGTTVTFKSGAVQNGFGYGVSVTGGATFIMESGKITENGGEFNYNAEVSSYNKNGYGGVHISGGAFDMRGGEITGNKGKVGGGVHLYGGTFSVSGSAQIYGNHRVTRTSANISSETSVANNVYLNRNNVISCGALVRGAHKIGVTLEDGKGRITSGFSANNGSADPADYFSAENPASGTTLKLKGGEAVVAGNAVATVIIGEVETDYDSFSTALSAVDGASGAVTLRLEADVTLDAPWNIAAGKNITLDLNGYVYRYNWSAGSNPIHAVIVKGQFTLKDSGPSVTHKYTKDNDGRFIFGTSGNEILYGGVLTRTENRTYGGGISVDGGTLNILGGNVAGNYAYEGGVVHIKSGTLYMSGGSICGNRSNGSALYIESGSATISGSAKIAQNTSGASGGGVYVKSGASLTIDGGEIRGNSSSSYGGGIYSAGTVAMSGGTIAGNTANNGGGITVAGGGEFTMESGTIGGDSETDRNTANNGGGVYVGMSSTYKAVFDMFGGTVTANDTATNGKGGGVYIQTYSGKYGELNVKNAPVIAGNMSSGRTESQNADLYVTSGAYVNVTGALTDGARIAFVMEKVGKLTIGYGSNNGGDDPSKYFTYKSDTKAVELEGGEVNVKQIYVKLLSNDGALIGSYTTFDEAWTAAGSNSGGKIVILSFLSLTKAYAVPTGKRYSIDLNGYDLTYSGTSDTSAYLFTVNGVLDITDGSTTGKGVINGDEKIGGILVASGGALNMSGGSVTNCKSDGGGVHLSSGGHMSVSGTSRVYENYNRAIRRCNLYIEDGGALTIGVLTEVTDNYRNPVKIGVTLSNVRGSFSAGYASNNSGSVGDYFAADRIVENGSYVYLCLFVSGDALVLDDHSYGEWNVTKQPSCTETGSQKRSCVHCGKVETQTIAKTPHTLDFESATVTKQPTCTQNGTQTGVCSVCGTSMTATIDKLGHKYEGEWEITKSATCTTDGEKQRLCSHGCGTSEKQTIQRLGHAYGDWVITKTATCTETGGRKCVCSHGCGIDEVEETAALGHDDGRWVTTIEPTEQSTGMREKHCTHCNALLDTQVIPKIDPSLDGYNAIMQDPDLRGALDYDKNTLTKDRIDVAERLINAYDGLNDANKNAFTDDQKQKISDLRQRVDWVRSAEDALALIKDPTVEKNIRPDDARRAFFDEIDNIAVLIRTVKGGTALVETDLDGYADYVNAIELKQNYYDTYEAASEALSALRDYSAYGIKTGNYTRDQFAAALERAENAVAEALAAGSKPEDFTYYYYIDKNSDDNKYIELGYYDAYLAFKAENADVLALDPDMITALNVESVGSVCAVYKAFGYEVRSLFTTEESEAIDALYNMSYQVKRFGDTVKANIALIAQVTLDKFGEDYSYSDTVENAISSIENALSNYVSLNTSTAETDFEGLEFIDRVKGMLAEYNGFKEFRDEYSIRYTTSFSDYNLETYFEMYEAYTALSDAQKLMLGEENRAKIEELKAQADKYVARKEEAQSALNALKQLVDSSDITFAELKAAYDAASSACDDFDNADGTPFLLDNYGALSEASYKLIEMYGDEIDRRLNALDISKLTAEYISELTDAELDAIGGEASELIEFIEGAPIDVRYEYADALAELETIVENIENEKAERADAPVGPDRPDVLDDPINQVDAEKEPVHGGWLAIDLILALLLIAEICYLVFHKRLMPVILEKVRARRAAKVESGQSGGQSETDGDNSYGDGQTDADVGDSNGGNKMMSVAPLAVLGTMHAGGWAAGVTFFVLLLLVDIVLALWVVNAVIIDLGKVSPLSAVLNKVETTTVAIAKKVWSKIKQASIFVWNKMKQAARSVKTKTAKLFKKGESTVVEQTDKNERSIADAEQTDEEDV